MEAIKIGVNKQMDGLTFSIAPSLRTLIKSWYPDARPANTISVSYDVKSDFGVLVGNMEDYIYPVLLGVNDKELNEKVNKILFIDTQTGSVLHTHTVS